ncbi:peptidoglycan DD-metalloendopeptidase family protein [Streptomyces sp. NPDC090231]|uniref:peptidoglycan DD-metalloendopeptidase family protein n=1 Tax=unclassified Streptomyces TaxID=2593676 RepID=UPI00381EDDD8
MADLDIVGSAAVDVVPIIPQFHTKLKALVLPVADKVGEEAGKRMGEAISKNIVIAIPNAINQGGKAGVRAAGQQGDDAGGAFARSIRRKLQAAFKAMPKLDVRLGDEGVDAELARIRSKLESLSTKRIGIDVSAEAAEAEIVRLEAKLRELGAQHPNVAVRADTATARAALAEIRAEIAAIGGRQTVTVEVDGAFGAKLRAVVAEAQASLPDINVDADTTPARAEIQGLRARLEALADARVGIDIDAGAALAEITAIQTRLGILSMQRTDIDVRVDAAAALTQLAAVRALAGDETKHVSVDTSQAMSALMGLGIQVAVLAALPVAPALLAGLGGIAALATAAGAGVGALALAAIPAIKGVTTAITAKKAAEDEANKATDNGARASVQAAQRALQMTSAQSALSSAYRNAARSIASSNRAIADAERAVGDAVERAADQRRQAAQTIARAQESLVAAHKKVRDAQEALTATNVSAKQAEQDLADARKDAAKQLEGIQDRLKDGALDQREATLRVQQAQQDLNETLASFEVGKATQLQVDAAQLAFDRAKQNASEQKKSYKDLTTEAAKQAVAGVEGSDAVIAAQKRLTDAQKAVKDQTQAVADAQGDVRKQAKAVADAQSDAARAQVRSARDVSDAQRGVSDAMVAAADAQKSAAETVASAERGVESARLSGIDTTANAVTKTDEYREALAKLSAPQRDLFDAIAGPKGLKVAFDDWQKTLQPEVLPLFTQGVDGAKASLPGLTPLVLGAAAGIQTLMDKASAQLKTPFWKGFKADLKESVQPAVEGFGVAFGNVIKGVAGVIDAFLPHMDGIAAKSDSITGRFANWGTSLKGSPKFEKFLQYVKDTSPGLAEFIGQVMRTALDLTKALAPLSASMFGVMGPLLNALSWIAVNAPGVIQALWLVYAAVKAIKLMVVAFEVAMVVYRAGMVLAVLLTRGWTAALWQANIAFEANPIVALVTIIIVALVALVAGVMYAYKHWGWFHDAVDGALHGIAAAATWLWSTILQPAFDGIWTGLKAIGTAAVWVWENAISPAFDFIGKAAQLLFTALVTVLLLPAYLAFQALGEVGTWLWEKAIKPAFDSIGDAASWLWTKAIDPVFGWIGDKAKSLYDTAIKPAMKNSKDSFDALAATAKWLWNKILSPVFGWIAEKAKWLWDKGLKPPFALISDGLDLVASAFKTAKDNIKTQWDQLKKIASTPVKFIIDHVYNKGIVPLWNGVAGITGAGKLKPMDLKGFATGGIMSGYSPGRDDRVIAVGGGEAVMRPEWTRAVGADRINSWNAAARTGGVGGVQRAISDGMPAFKDGGVVGSTLGWFKDRGKDVGNAITGITDYLDPTKIFNKAKDFLVGQMKPILTNPWAKSVAKAPVEMLTGLKDKALSLLDLFGGGGGGNGTWRKPVNVPYGTRFGASGSMWSSGHHTGLDFPAALGVPVKAVAEGRVSMATSGGPYGNHVMINHGGGLSSLYAHMSRILTSVGTAVTQGQVIGKVGATGNVTGPHLHLEARLRGKAIDPMGYLTNGAGSGGSGVQRWRGVVNQALNLTGNPSSYAGVTLQRMQQESGGNPRAVNNWDSNARAGYPSTGLMQVIRPTFQHYAGSMSKKGPFLNGVSVDPLANVYSSMRYAKAAYGNLGKAYGRPGGYANGGYPPVGQFSIVGENGPELAYFSSPAQVISNTDTRSMFREAAGQKGGGGATTITADVRVFVGDREITDIVRTEVTAHEASTASAIETGRWI